MDYWDLGLRSGDPLVIEMAKRLGFSGVGVFQSSARRKELDIALGIELLKNPRNKARSVRGRWELIASVGREAVETPEVDIVWVEEMNNVMVRLAKKNNVAIAFSFRPLLHASKKQRGSLLAGYFQVAKLVRKYKAPFILSSGAVSPWDIRSPSDLIAFGKLLGFSENDCRLGLSGKIVKENRKRLGRGWIRPGVETV